MQISCCILDIHEIVVDASLLYEGTLIVGDQGIQTGCKPVCKELGEDFCNAVDEADGPEVRNLERIHSFWEEDAAG